MRYDKLTIKGQEALSEAQSLATGRGHSQIAPAHLFRALLDQPEGATIPILQKIGVPVDGVATQVEETLQRLPRVSGGAQPQISPELSTVLDRAFQEAEARKDEYISTEHLLLALSEDADRDLKAILQGAGASPENVRKGLDSVRGGARVTDQDPESKYQALGKFGRDLTDLARIGKRLGRADPDASQACADPGGVHPLRQVIRHGVRLGEATEDPRIGGGARRREDVEGVEARLRPQDPRRRRGVWDL